MRLALGTVQFGLTYGVANRTGQVNRSMAKAMLQLALEHGIDMLDTAIAYGESEASLGDVGIQGFQVVTKLPAVPDGCADVKGWVDEQLAASLQRLGVSAMHGLLLHRPQQLLQANGKELYRSLQMLKESGVVEKIGVSIYAPSELDELSLRYRFDLVQAPFSLVDRRLATSGWLQRLREAGVEVHTRSAFLQGLLLMSRDDIPDKFSPWGSLWTKWHAWLTQSGGSPLSACLAFPLSFTEIDRVVVGADSVRQLEQIIGAAQHDASLELPDLECHEDELMNPARWAQL